MVATTVSDRPRCEELAAAGYGYREALDYWLEEGAPVRMDADRNGIPCETVYPSAQVRAVLAELAPTTQGEVFPEALSRDLVPWARLGPGWYLAVFKGADNAGDGFDVDRPSVLYLIHQSGVIYELDSWPGWGTDKYLHDWSPDGRFALTSTFRASEENFEFVAEVVDLKTQKTTTLREDIFDWTVDYRYSFTRPTGRNIVAVEYDRESSEETLRRLRRDGSVIATVVTQETRWYGDKSFLYHYDGTGEPVDGPLRG